MKKSLLAVVAVAALSIPSFAGVVVHHASKKAGPEPLPECFRAGELQLDVFGSWNDTANGTHGDGFGGGLGVNYFVTRNLGLGVEGNIWNGNGSAIWNPNGNVIFRWPVELGGHCFAPYVFGGGGGTFDGTKSGEGHAGGGLEFRANQHMGIFADGRHGFGGDNDFTTVRVGLRFVF